MVGMDLFTSVRIFLLCVRLLMETSSLCSLSTAKSFRLLQAKPLATRKNQLETRGRSYSPLFFSYSSYIAHGKTLLLHFPLRLLPFVPFSCHLPPTRKPSSGSFWTSQRIEYLKKLKPNALGLNEPPTLCSCYTDVTIFCQFWKKQKNKQ